ncbi:rod shape-determining protein RodA [bacterium]|nr:rod shape-determining protein RodA [bacterium]
MATRYGRIAGKRYDRPRGDIWLTILLITLTIIGLVYLYSATYQPPDPEAGQAYFYGITKYVWLQLAWLALGIGVFRLISRADLTVPPFHWAAIYLLIIGMLVLVILIGYTAGGSTRWLSLGAVRFQPSEFAKIGFVLVTAHIFTQPGGINWDRFWLAVGLLSGIIVLIILQPDLGTALVFVSILAIQLFLARNGWRFLVIFFIIVVLIAGFGWKFVLHDYQKERILGFVHPEEERRYDRDWQVNQAKIAIGSGGLFGKGLRQGTQTHGNFVPSDHTDFIFCVLAEESGFAGCSVVLILFMLLVLRITWVAQIAGTEYQRMIAYGISAIIFFQVLVNIGMNTGVLPVTGLPLPFFSYGGNSLLTMYLALGICQSIVKNRSRVG